MRLKEKVALITGGGGDIGGAIAEKFLAEGAHVILFDLSESLLKETAQKLAVDSELITVVGNVCQIEDLQRAVDIGVRRFGKIDILVTSAGVLKHMPIDELTLDDWNMVVSINLTGTYLSCKALVPVMKKHKYGRIVTIASLGGRTGRPGVGVDYAAAKAGVIGVTQTLARELGPYGITVNVIAPGPLKGRMMSSISQENVDVLLSNACVPRLGQPGDIANAALFLASDEAEWITGEVLDVNGGIYI